MKVTVKEFDYCFSIDLYPENMEDTAVLSRFAMNSTKEVRSKSFYISRNSDGSYSQNGYVVFGKRKQPKSRIE